MVFSRLFRTPWFSLALLSGALIGISYIPFPLFTAFFCLTPLWYSWNQETSLKKVFLSGWIAQFLLTLIGFHWIAYTAATYGHLPWAISILILIGFCAIANLHVPLSGALWFWLKKRGSSAPLWLLPLLFFVFETYFIRIFDWNFGYIWMTTALPAKHGADVYGFHGLSLLTLFCNYLILQAILHKKSQQKYKWALGFVALFLFMNLFGYFRLQEAQKITYPKHLNALVIQANIGNYEKEQAEKGNGFQWSILQKYLDSTRTALKKFPQADVIIWPETAFPAYIGGMENHNIYTQSLFRFAQEIQKPILTGAYEKDDSGKPYNALILVNQEGQLQSSYRKINLLAFGEYFPGAEYYPDLKKLIPEISDFGRGAGPTLQTLNQIQIGGQICYEGLFPPLSQQLEALGADMIVNVTNDSWFGTTFEPSQHMFMTLARAIEIRKPLVRSTNMGHSVAINALGEVMERSPLHQEWAYLYEISIPDKDHRTSFVKWGYQLPNLITLITFLIYFLLLIKKHKKRGLT